MGYDERTHVLCDVVFYIKDPVNHAQAKQREIHMEGRRKPSGRRFVRQLLHVSTRVLTETSAHAVLSP